MIDRHFFSVYVLSKILSFEFPPTRGLTVVVRRNCVSNTIFFFIILRVVLSRLFCFLSPEQMIGGRTLFMFLFK